MSATANKVRLADQLEGFARTRPDRLAFLLASLKESAPAAFEELVLSAVHHGDLELEEGASMLTMDSCILALKVSEFGEEFGEAEVFTHVAVDSHGVARVQGSIIAVWEIVRGFRRVDSVTELGCLFPSLTEGALRGALAYAGNHPDEIARQIQSFEDFQLEITAPKDLSFAAINPKLREG